MKHQRYDGYSVCRAHFDSNRSGTKLRHHILSFVYRFLVLVRVKISPQPMRTQLENNTGNWFTFEYFTVEMNKSGGVNKPVSYIIFDIFIIIRSTPVIPHGHHTEATAPAHENKHTRPGLTEAVNLFSTGCNRTKTDPPSPPCISS